MFKTKKELLGIGFRLMQSIHSHFNGSSFEKEIYELEHQSLIIPGGIRFAFRYWGDKPAYIILFKGSRFVHELDLSRIIENARKYTWHLSRPTHKDNKKLMDKLFRWEDEINPKYREAMIVQKIKYDAGTSVQKGGFVFIDNAEYNDVETKLLDLLDNVISLHLGYIPVNKKESYDIEDAKAIEGYQSDKRYLHTKRNQEIVKKRKQKDDYTCQTCKFQLMINNRYIIECHHAKPLAGGETRVTNIEDLVCLCPTCHRIAHTQNPPLTIKEITSFLKKKS